MTTSFTTKYLAAVAALGLTTVLLAGCSMESASAGKTTSSENVTADDAKSETATPAAEEKADTNAKFGETVSYEGLDLSVSTPEPFTPSQFAAGGTQPNNVVVTFTIKNTGSENFDPALIYATMSSAGQEAEGVYDSEQGINSTPTTTVPAGQTITWKQAFNVADPAKLIMDVTPGSWDYEAATFTN